MRTAYAGWSGIASVDSSVQPHALMTFIDTNILIHAQSAGAKSEVARQTILAGGVISVQVLNEFAAVLRRKFGFEWEVIAEAIADVRTVLEHVRPIDVLIHTEAVSLAHTHRFSFHDSLIIASALEAGCDTLLTEDLQTGRRIAGLTIVNPFA